VNDFEPCGASSPIVGLSACPLDKGHQGEHLYWREEAHDDGENTYGYQVFDAAGKSVVFLDTAGKLTPHELGAYLIISGQRARRARGTAG
jgi:hypothetical protein